MIRRWLYALCLNDAPGRLIDGDKKALPYQEKKPVPRRKKPETRDNKKGEIADKSA
jgi:hypothetical protein